MKKTFDHTGFPSVVARLLIEHVTSCLLNGKPSRAEEVVVVLPGAGLLGGASVELQVLLDDVQVGSSKLDVQ